LQARAAVAVSIATADATMVVNFKDIAVLQSFRV
jgi:hypothetical protein